MKASVIDRQFSMTKLCKRLGDFIPGDYSTLMPKIELEPVSRIAEDHWRAYRKARLIEAGRRTEPQLTPSVAQARRWETVYVVGTYRTASRHDAGLRNFLTERP